jgi:pimeloyl-ACP methyl ester carboxylesterase
MRFAQKQGETTMTHYQYATIDGYKMFYREAGPKDGRTLVLLHGFPSSSHMFRELIPLLEDRFHIIAPDYLGFGYSDQPSEGQFAYSFDSLTAIIEKLLFEELRLSRFSIYVQDYGAPVGFRIASRHPEAIEGMVVQNGNAYTEDIGAAFEPFHAFWANRNPETEKPVRALLSAEMTRFQYTHGTTDPTRISPDSHTFDQIFSIVPETTPFNSLCFTITRPTSLCMTNGTRTSGSTNRPH